MTKNINGNVTSMSGNIKELIEMEVNEVLNLILSYRK